ncbi:MAG: hypothetical protein ACLGH3_07950 [Actinomycetota bacterium]
MSAPVAGLWVVLAFALPAAMALLRVDQLLVRIAAVVLGAWAMVVAGPAEPSIQGGLAVDAWRGGLVIALVICVLGAIWLTERVRTALLLEAAGAALVLVSGHAVVAAVGFLIMTAAAIGETWNLQTPIRNAPNPYHLNAGVSAAADVSLLTGLALGASSGLAATPRFDGPAAWLIGLAVLLRLGIAVSGMARPLGTEVRATVPLLPLVLVAGWIDPASTPGKAFLIAAASATAFGAWRAARVGDAAALPGPWMGLAIVAVAVGSPTSVTTAIGFVAAATLAPLLVSAFPAAGMLTIVVPGALAFPSAIALSEALAAAAPLRTEFVFVASAVAVAAVWLSVALLAGVRANLVPAGIETRVGALVALGGLAVTIGLAAEHLFAEAGRDVIASLGLSVPLPAPSPPMGSLLLPAGGILLISTLLASRFLGWGSTSPAVGTLADPELASPPVWFARGTIALAAISTLLLAVLVWRSADLGWL